MNRDGLYVLFSNLAVEFITTDENSPGWFLLRSFAITPSAADRIFDHLYQEAQSRMLSEPLLSDSMGITRYYSIIEGTDSDSNEGDSDRSGDDSEVKDVEPDEE